MGTHLRNAASDASRWMGCPGSLRLESQLPPQPETEWQHEGVKAHKMYELMLLSGADSFAALKQRMGDLRAFGLWGEITPEMVEQVEWAVDRTYELVDQAGEDCTFESELQSDLSWLTMPQCGGTTDARIKGNRQLWIIDLKYGWKRVSALDNKQMMVYALMQGQDILDLADEIHLVILQPKVSQEVDVWTIKTVDLLNWAASTLVPLYERTFEEDAPLVPSDDACHWCPANGICNVSFTRAVAKVGEIRTMPVDVVPIGQIAPVLAYESEIKAFFSALKKRAFEFEANGIRVPGMKWVKVATKFKFEEEVIQELAKTVPEEVLYERKVKTPAQLSKAGFKALAERFKTRPDRKTLVLTTDKREPVEPGTAADLFGEYEGE
jgi:hypothetical protein